MRHIIDNPNDFIESNCHLASSSGDHKALQAFLVGGVGNWHWEYRVFTGPCVTVIENFDDAIKYYNEV